MELVELLKTLKEHQVHLSVDQNKLNYRAPKGVIDARIKASLKAHKSTLIQILSEGGTTDPVLPDPHNVPLTTAQRQVWIAYQVLPAPLAVEQYHVTLGFDCNQNLDLVRFKKALKQTINQFDALNIRFHLSAKGPQQGYCPSDADIPVIPSHEQDWATQTQAFVAEKFDLVQNPPFRIVVFRSEKNNFRFLWCIHHILCDGYSLSLISQKLLTNYLHPHQSTTLNEFQFLTHAYQQPTGNPDAAVQPWLQTLSAIDPDLWLEQADPFTESEPPGGKDLEPAIHQDQPLHSFKFDFKQPFARKIDTQAKYLKASTFEYLISVYALIVYQLTHQNSFSISIPESGRTSQTIDTVGLFANARLVAININSNDDMRQQLANLIHQIRYSLTLPAIPLEYLLSRLKSDSQTATANDGFQQLGFSYYHDTSNVLTTTRFSIENTEFNPIPLQRSSHRKKMSLLVHRSADNLTFEWHFKSGCVSKRTARIHCELFNEVLTNLDLEPCKRDNYLLPVPQWQLAQTRLISNQINNPKPDQLRSEKLLSSPDTDGIGWLFGPHKDQDIAVRFSQNSRMISYGELKSQVNSLAIHFYELGIRPGQRIYLDLKRSLNSLLSTLATWTIGAVYCPLNIELPIAQKLKITGNSIVLTKNVNQWRKHTLGTVIDIEEVINSANQTQHHNPQTPHKYRWTLQAPFYHLQTSGTTGNSKAVEVTYGNIRHYLNGAMGLYRIRDKKHVLHHTELSFDVSMVELLIGFHSGGCMTIYEGGIMDAAQLSTLLREYRLDTISLTASHWQRLVSSPDFVLDEFPRQFKVGAEPLPAAVADLWLQRFGPTQELFNVYGPTETTVGITGKHITTTAEQTYKGQVTIGSNFLGYTLVCDPYGKPLAAEKAGELWIFGPTVSNGYFQQPALTEKSFLKIRIGSEKIPGYKTGDLVIQRANGEFFILGRKDHQIKWRGYRIELNAIELRLQQYPTVKRCVLVPLKNAKGHIENLAAVLLTNELEGSHNKKFTAPSLDEQNSLNAFLLKQFPDYCLPSQYFLATQLPLRISGKLDRVKLEHWIREAHAIADPGDQIITNPVENTIAKIWRKLLQQQKIDTRKNFFDHGGHSLLLLDLLNELKQAYPINLELVDLFELTTVHQLAAYIESNTHEIYETTP